MAKAGLVWFRNDLRVADNPSLNAAIRTCDTVTALYVAETDADLRPTGAAARAWIANSLAHLSQSLADRGIALTVVEGESADIVPAHARRLAADRVTWNRRYGPAERTHDADIKKGLEKAGVAVESFNGRLLVEPWEIQTQSGTPYAVFTPFWKALRTYDIREPARAPDRGEAIAPPRIEIFEDPAPWAKKVLSHWEPGEEGARQALRRFVDGRLTHYSKGRDIPAREHTSALSPHLHHGEISPNQVWHTVRHAMARDEAVASAGDTFLSELAWREFCYNLLFHHWDIVTVPMREKYARMDWRSDAKALEAWKAGQTGIPIVDAGMRQLWETGWMHNRVRMIVASLLTKNLLIDWREGERWFWDTLVDADPANNPASWQWVAGSGADAAPYFRIFNPATQGERFDTDGEYVRGWVPEISGLKGKRVHAPWSAGPQALQAAGIELGKDYPEPIVDLKGSRKRALQVFGALE